MTPENKAFIKRVVERNEEMLSGPPFRVREKLRQFTQQLQDLIKAEEGGTADANPSPTETPAQTLLKTRAAKE